MKTLAEQAEKLLETYSKEVTEQMKKVIKKDVNSAKRDLQGASPRKTGKYASGWSVKDEGSKLTTNFVIYNKTPGLPHLLEFGHVIRNGTGRTYGSVGGRSHIAGVNDELQKKVVQDLEQALSEVTP